MTPSFMSAGCYGVVELRIVLLSVTLSKGPRGEMKVASLASGHTGETRM